MYDVFKNADLYESELDMALNTLNFKLSDYQTFYREGKITKEEMKTVKEFFNEKKGKEYDGKSNCGTTTANIHA